jgi:predicted transglutaminase-like cysteine proteinase
MSGRDSDDGDVPMLHIARPRALAFAVTAAFALGSIFATATGVSAKPKAKKPASAARSDQGPSRPADGLLKVDGPVFFTLNAVLAKTRAAAASRPLHLPERIGAEPFGLFAFRAPEGPLWHKWHRVEASLRHDAAALEACRGDTATCSRSVARFLAIVREAAARVSRARLEYVNDVLNDAIQYTTDIVQHGVVDRWSSPLETLASGRGDCEDYAIAKYAALRESGVPAANLRIVLLRDAASRSDHAVLAARDDGSWYVLDNRGALFARDLDLPHYAPLFVLTQGSVYAWTTRDSVVEPAVSDGGDGDRDGEAEPALVVGG